MGLYVENKCHQCQHKRAVPGSAHIQCLNPDPDMKGDPHGIGRGWFFYPLVFDPVWMEAKCHNYEAVKGKE